MKRKVVAYMTLIAMAASTMTACGTASSSGGNGASAVSQSQSEETADEVQSAASDTAQESNQAGTEDTDAVNVAQLRAATFDMQGITRNRKNGFLNGMVERRRTRSW